MGIQNIHQVILEEESAEPVQPDRLVGYEGKFITFDAKDGRSFIFSFRGARSHPDLSNRFFMTHEYRAERLELPQDGIDHFGRPMGGGRIMIDNENILLFGTSDTFGGYSKERVIPFLEKWATEYLPKHRIPNNFTVSADSKVIFL